MVHHRHACLVFFNLGQSRPLFVYFHPFLIPTAITVTILTIKINGVHGIRTWGYWMVGETKPRS